MTSKPDTVVVGGGVIGCMTAYRLSKRTKRDIRVIEQKQIAAEATGLSAGLVAPSLYLAEWPEGARLAYEFFEELDGTGTFEFTRRARLDFCKEEKASRYRAEAERLSDRGFSVEYLTADEVEVEYDRFNMDEYAGANRHHKAGWVDPYSLATTLKDEAANRGVEFDTGVTVESVETTNGQVVGVETDSGSIATDSVVVAAGWRTREILDDQLTLPIQPYQTPCVILDTGEPLDDTFPLGRVADDKYLYFRPEHSGNLLVGGGEAAVETPTAASTGTAIDPEFKRILAQKLPQLFTGAEEMEIVDSWAGVDGATPDGRAIIDGPGLDTEGIVVATGFNGLGIACSPIAGELVSAFVSDTEPTIETEPFRLSRFETISTEFEFGGLHHET